MKIYVDRLPDEGLEIDYQEPAESFDYLEKGSEARINGTVQVSLFAKKRGEGVDIKGRVQGSASMTCSRCLDGIEDDISHDFFYTCLPAEEMKREEERLSMEETDLCYFPGNEIDVTALVQEQVSLAIPMRPLCKDDCKGLCPKCGANLNLGDCGCEKKPVDLRFAALKDIKIK